MERKLDHEPLLILLQKTECKFSPLWRVSGEYSGEIGGIQCEEVVYHPFTGLQNSLSCSFANSEKNLKRSS